MISARELGLPMEVWRTSFLRSPETFHVQNAPLRPLFVKELWEILGGRALWTMLLLMCPLVGYSFFQAISLYGEASAAGLQSPVLANSLSPLDGVLVPTLGASYVAVTLLFPFVAIRVLGQEKESGALRLLIQLPYRSSTLIAAKLAAVLAAWVFSSVPAFSALAIWRMLGGHLSVPETLNLLLGHLLYGLLVGTIALFAAAVSESAATAAIVTLAFTIGSWVLDFTVAGHPGLLEWIAGLSLTQVLRTFEQGLLSAGLVVGVGTALCGFATLATIWLPPGVNVRNKLFRSIVCVFATATVLGLMTQIGLSIDVSEDQRNSFPVADQRVLAKLAAPLVVTVHLAPEDPRYADLQRNVLAKLERVLPNLSIRLAGGRQSLATNAGEDRYGEVEYTYGGRSDVSRSTSPREILPMLYGLAGVNPPAPASGGDYPGYPLVAGGQVALLWFFCGLPLCIALAWWWSRRLPKPITARSRRRFNHEHK
jgi:ABC-2 type transport system permease protein